MMRNIVSDSADPIGHLQEISAKMGLFLTNCLPCTNPPTLYEIPPGTSSCHRAINNANVYGSKSEDFFSNTNLRTNVFITVADIITYTINTATLNLIKIMTHLLMRKTLSRFIENMGNCYNSIQVC